MTFFVLGLFPLFNGSVSTSYVEEVYKNGGKMLYMLPTIIAAVANLAAKFYSIYLNKKMEQTLSDISINNKDTKKTANRFAMSLDTSFGLLLCFMFTLVSSFATRELRLILLFPIQLSFISVIVPMVIINRDLKIKIFIKKNYISPMTS